MKHKKIVLSYFLVQFFAATSMNQDGSFIESPLSMAPVQPPSESMPQASTVLESPEKQKQPHKSRKKRAKRSPEELSSVEFTEEQLSFRSPTRRAISHSLSCEDLFLLDQSHSEEGSHVTFAMDDSATYEAAGLLQMQPSQTRSTADSRPLSIGETPAVEPFPTFSGFHRSLKRPSAHILSRERPRRPSVYVPVERPLEETETKIVMSFDGGGSRGIIQVFYLMELIRCNNGALPVHMIAGTSTGALNATALILGQIEDLFAHYPKYVSEIFTSKTASLSGLTKPRYMNRGKLNVLKRFIGDYSAKTLAETSGVDIVIPFYDCSSRTPKVFMSFDRHQRDFSLVDLLMMTTAAPTFFNPYICKAEDGTEYEGADAGLFANNPTLVACMAAREKYPNARLVVFSFGTGDANLCEKIGHFQDKGMVWWGSEISDIIIDGHASFTGMLLRTFSSQLGIEYVRLQTPLQKVDMALNSTDPKQLGKITSAARANIRPGRQGYEAFQRFLSIIRESRPN